jgi:hypothetical protein
LKTYELWFMRQKFHLVKGEFMLKLIIGIYIFAILAASTSFSAISDVDRADISAKNKLSNSGFENGKVGWTASGGTFSTVTSGSELLNGKVSATWDSSAAAQTLTGPALTIPNGLKGRNAELSCLIRVPSGVATHKLQIYDGTSVLNEVVLSSSSTPAVNIVTAPFPTSGSIRPRIISVAANEPSISIDDCYLDEVKVTQVAQAKFLGTLTYSGAASCRWQANNGSFADYAADTDCTTPTVTGVLQALPTKKPGFRVPYVGVGALSIKALGNFRKDNTDTGNWPLFRFSDGINFSASQGVGATSTNTAATSPVLAGTLAYVSSQTNLDINIQSTSTTGAVSSEIYAEAADLTFEVYFYPSTSSVAVTSSSDPAITDWQSCTTTVSGLGTGSGTSSCKYRRVGDSANYAISFTKDGSSGTGSTSVTFTLEGSQTIDTSKLTGTTNQASLGQGIFILTGSSQSAFSVGYAGSNTVKMDYLNTVYSLAGADIAASSIVNLEFTVPISGWKSPTANAPKLVGSVFSSTLGSLKIEKASVSDTGVVSGETSDFINGNCPITSTSTFTCSFNAGAWSSAPTCFPTIGSFAIAAYIGATTTASDTIVKTYTNAGAAAQAFAFDVLCVGVK